MTVQEQIAEWLKDPSVLEDDGLDAPTTLSLTVAAALAQIMTPTRIVPSGDGGIVFTWDRHKYSLEVEWDGSVDFKVWQDVKIAARYLWKYQR